MTQLPAFGFLLRDVSRLYVQRYEEKAHALAVTMPQCKALAYLDKHEGVSQSQLSQLTDIEPMNLVRILDRMEADGWIERRAHAADRRASSLYLKPKAKPLLDEIWRLAALARSEAFAGVSKGDRECFMSVLAHIRANLARDAAHVSGVATGRARAAAAAKKAPARPRKTARAAT